jgi:hypothetical protein
MRRERTVGIATGYMLDGRGSILAKEKKFFSGAHLASHSVGTGGDFPGSKAVGA